MVLIDYVEQSNICCCVFCSIFSATLIFCQKLKRITDFKDVSWHLKSVYFLIFGSYFFSASIIAQYLLGLVPHSVGCIFWQIHLVLKERSDLVFCCQNCSDLLWETIVLVIEKNFWNSRLKAENLQKFWDHWNNLFKEWKVRRIFGNRMLF